MTASRSEYDPEARLIAIHAEMHIRLQAVDLLGQQIDDGAFTVEAYLAGVFTQQLNAAEIRLLMDPVQPQANQWVFITHGQDWRTPIEGHDTPVIALQFALASQKESLEKGLAYWQESQERERRHEEENRLQRLIRGIPSPPWEMDLSEALMSVAADMRQWYAHSSFYQVLTQSVSPEKVCFIIQYQNDDTLLLTLQANGVRDTRAQCSYLSGPSPNGEQLNEILYDYLKSSPDDDQPIKFDTEEAATERAHTWGDTTSKLARLREIRTASISNGVITLTWTSACQLAGIDPKTAKQHAPSLRRRWNDVTYRENRENRED